MLTPALGCCLLAAAVGLDPTTAAAATEGAAAIKPVAPLWSMASLMALVTLTALEIVLGIDNIIFISILSGRLPEHQRKKARQTGLILAMGMRILLLLSLTWVMGLTKPLITVLGASVTGKDLVLILGGAFLMAKSTTEIHHKMEGGHGAAAAAAKVVTFASVIVQILLLDIVFSLDSVITAVGMADHIEVMIAAVVISVIVMLVVAGPIAGFVERHPTIKILALSFLLMIGVMLVAEGFGVHIPKGYIYFAMAFSLAVELVNLKVRKQHAVAAAAK